MCHEKNDIAVLYHILWHSFHSAQFSYSIIVSYFIKKNNAYLYGFGSEKAHFISYNRGEKQENADFFEFCRDFFKNIRKTHEKQVDFLIEMYYNINEHDKVNRLSLFWKYRKGAPPSHLDLFHRKRNHPSDDDC